MRAGRLNEIVEIWRSNVTVNEYGERDEEDMYVCKTRAAVRNTSGGRTEPNNEIFYSYSYEFILRSYIPVVDTDRIKWQGKFYLINSLQKRREMNDILIYATKVNE